MKRRAFLTAAALSLTGCSLTPPAPTVALYDFGPPPAPPAGTGTPLRIAAVVAPPWLDSAEIAYRLDFRDPHRREAYRDSRWVAPPAALLGARLRQRAAGGTGAPATLFVQLDECAQVFSAPTQSRVVLRLRARLVAAGAAEVGPERAFAIERDAPTPDAQGAVRGLSQAADELIDRLLTWSSGS